MRRLFYAVAVFLMVSSVQAAQTPVAVTAALERLLPGRTADEIVSAPLPGWYEAVFGARVFYLSEDGRYLFDGVLLDTQSRTNLTSQRMDRVRAESLAAVSLDQMIVFGPKTPKHRVAVFTDIDCGYCRKLHQDMAEINALGIEIRYLWFPRAGVGSDSYDKAVSVWCSDDRKASITAAKQQQEVPQRSCDNPVQAQFELGQMIGVAGTPAMVLEDGSLLPGYLPPERLLQTLDARLGQ